MDSTFIQARIEATKLQIIAYEDAVLAIGTNNVQSYELDTGQSRQRVTRADLKEMQAVLDGLYNRCATLETRLNGSGTTRVRPAW